jgi:FkbH-like protein
MLDWLPEAADFAPVLRSTREATPERRLEALAALAQHRLDYLQMIQLDRALSSIDRQASPGLPQVRLAALGSSTLEHLMPAIRVAGLRRGLRIQAHCGAYGQYRSEVLEPDEALVNFAPQVVLFSLSCREALAGISAQSGSSEVAAALDAFVEQLQHLWSRAHSRFEARILQQTFLDVTQPLFGSFDRLVPGAPSRVLASLNDRVARAAEQEGVHLVDVARASERDGRAVWHDIGKWLHAKQEIAPQAAAAYGELVARVVGAMFGRSKKCLVLDLDNTLWSGVVGDDGIEGIVLGNGSAVGEAHAALQRYAKRLRTRGILLAVCSKNDPQIAASAIERHPEMVLRMSDFASFKANWQDKAENLRAIAAELNIGIDSLVFVDDNPVERARVRSALPTVAVPELPADPAAYVTHIADAGYFESVSFTRDDEQRADRYTEEAQRVQLREGADTLEQFLEGLEMTVTYGPFAPVDLPRVAQLINKTNQFNLTNRRCTEQEVAELAGDSDNLTLQFRLRDRLGDNGLVSALILKRSADRPAMLELDTWVMSCRVFGRQLEREAMNIAVEFARARGISGIVGRYVATPKNAVVSHLYAQLGFTDSGTPDEEVPAHCWELGLDHYTPQPTAITRGARPT